MAAVTVTNTPTRHVLGDVVMRVFSVTGASGSTLDTGMKQILSTLVEPGTSITAISDSGGTLTFTSSGAMTAQKVVVLARVG